MKPIILMDGGLGQEITRRSQSVPTPLWSARIMLNEPEIVLNVHEDFIRNGAKIIALNNYTATPQRLARDGDASLLEPLHQAAIKLARQAINNCEVEDVLVAGCLPPLVASYNADVVPNFETCLASYTQLVALQNDGVDIFIAETMALIEEARAAVTAAKPTGKPVWVGFTLDDDETALLRSGERLSDAITAMEDLEVDAILVNCSMPETITRALPTLLEANVPVGAYANGFQSVDLLQPGGTVQSLSARKDLGPEAYADIALQWVKEGLQIIGGCCEVGPEHIACLNEKLIAAGFSPVSKF